MKPAFRRASPESAILVYVDYVTGLDNLMNTIPPRQYKNNVAAFARRASLQPHLYQRIRPRVSRLAQGEWP